MPIKVLSLSQDAFCQGLFIITWKIQDVTSLED